MPDISPRYWLMIATLGFVWGGTFLLIKIALTDVTPFWLAAYRITLAALPMTLIWGLRGFRLFQGSSAWRTVVLISILSTALPFALISWGQQHVPSGFTGVSMAAIALMILPLAHFFVPGEQMSLRKVIGMCFGFAGATVLIGAKAFDSSGSDLEAFGRAAVLASTACYAVQSILIRRLPPVDPVGLATVLLLIGSVLIVPLAITTEGAPIVPPPQTLWIILVLGVVSTGLANLLRVLVVRGAGPTFMTLTNFQVPLWAVVLGALLLGEDLPSSLLSALALILCGLGFSQYGPLKRLFFGKRSAEKVAP